MKSITIILFFILIYNTLAIGQTIIPQDTLITEMQERIFMGTINKKMAIQLTFTQKGDSLFGGYEYVNRDYSLNLKGNIDKAGIITLKEFNKFNNEITGVFKGRILNNLFKGNWISSDKLKKYSFELEEIIITKEMLNTPQTAVKIVTDFDGIWVTKNGDTLKMDLVDNEIMCFRIHSNSSGNCKGMIIEGQAIPGQEVEYDIENNITKIEIYKYSEHCKILFKYIKDLYGIQVIDNNCVNSLCHGFTGFYYGANK